MSNANDMRCLQSWRRMIRNSRRKDYDLYPILYIIYRKGWKAREREGKRKAIKDKCGCCGVKINNKSHWCKTCKKEFDKARKKVKLND